MQTYPKTVLKLDPIEQGATHDEYAGAQKVAVEIVQPRAETEEPLFRTGTSSPNIFRANDGHAIVDDLLNGVPVQRPNLSRLSADDVHQTEEVHGRVLGGLFTDGAGLDTDNQLSGGDGRSKIVLAKAGPFTPAIKRGRPRKSTTPASAPVRSSKRARQLTMEPSSQSSSQLSQSTGPKRPKLDPR